MRTGGCVRGCRAASCTFSQFHSCTFAQFLVCRENQERNNFVDNRRTDFTEMDEDDETQHRCAFCDASSTPNGNLMKCSGCLVTYYCNREHQVADWKGHKIFCKESLAKRSKEAESSQGVSISTAARQSTAEIIQIDGEIVSPKSARVLPGRRVVSDKLIDHQLDHQKPQNSFDQSLVQFVRQVIQPPATVRLVESTRTNHSSQSLELAATDQSISVIKSMNYAVPASLAASTCPIKRERLDGCEETVHHRVSVIQMAATSTASKPPDTVENNKKRSPRAEKPAPPAKKTKRSVSKAQGAAAAAGGSSVAGKSPGSASSSNIHDLGPKKDHSLNYPLDLERDSRFRTANSRQDGTSSRLAKIAQFAAASLREYGWTVVDKFMGERHCRGSLKEIVNLQEKGQFTEGRLMISKSGEQLHGVRSDTILFLSNGSDDGIHIGLLVAMVDSLIFQLTGSIPPYNVSGRTRPMLTCYPGQRSRYITHVDNPDNDGRCVTATYYVNEDWRPAHGGLLRLYPTSAFKQVDIEPVFDRLVLYWSDRRNPHEVLPSYRKRFSVNIWYFDKDEKAIAESESSYCDRESLSSRAIASSRIA